MLLTFVDAALDRTAASSATLAGRVTAGWLLANAVLVAAALIHDASRRQLDRAFANLQVEEAEPEPPRISARTVIYAAVAAEVVGVLAYAAAGRG